MKYLFHNCEENAVEYSTHQTECYRNDNEEWQHWCGSFAGRQDGCGRMWRWKDPSVAIPTIDNNYCPACRARERAFNVKGNDFVPAMRIRRGPEPVLNFVIKNDNLKEKLVHFSK